VLQSHGETIFACSQHLLSCRKKSAMMLATELAGASDFKDNIEILNTLQI
jgi:hypothetical protein